MFNEKWNLYAVYPCHCLLAIGELVSLPGVLYVDCGGFPTLYMALLWVTVYSLRSAIS
jgi:hypothetical protein